MFFSVMEQSLVRVQRLGEKVRSTRLVDFPVCETNMKEHFGSTMEEGRGKYHIFETTECGRVGALLK
jgi:hypothetical protein